MFSRFKVFWVGGVLTCCTGCPEQPLPPDVELAIGSHTLQAEIAATPEMLRQGLSQHPSLAENSGMLFVFPTLKRQCMWIRDVHNPLSAAFLDDKGLILSIARMQPESAKLHCSEEPAKYVLEMNAGWFVERGIGARAQVSGLP